MLTALVALATLSTTDVCPSRIQTAQRAKTVNVGWEAVESHRVHELDGLVFYFDHPSTLRELPPDATKRMSSGDRFYYVIPKGTRQLWVECYYWSTSVVLRKQLPRAIKKCEVRREPHRDILKSISCS